MLWGNRKPYLRFVSIVCGSIILLISSNLPLGSSQFGFNCLNVKCTQPPMDATCLMVDPWDKSIPRPTGPKSDCCPLWKCSRVGGNFFTFHGLTGAGPSIDGTETVQYSRSMNQASSVATGGHNSVAQAGGDMSEIDKALREINLAISGMGTGFQL